MKRNAWILGLVIVHLALAAAPAAAIGPGDLKKKAEKKAKETAEKAAQKAETPAAGEGETGDGGGGGSDAGTVSSVSTKFDFVPGNKILLMDDFTRDELGEFPARWKAYRGNFDTVEFEGERWLRLNGDDGTIAIKSDGLPEKWTLEFDIYQQKMIGPAFTVGGLSSGSGSFVWAAQIGQQGGTSIGYYGPDGVNSNAEASGGLNGRHHVSVMAAGTSVKIYLDRERLVNVAEMELRSGSSVEAVGFRFWRQNSDPMITNVRFAEGGKEKVDMMATPFVTQGIVFDSGSDRLKPESAPVLRQVATYLKENPEVKVMIAGYTDDVGDVAANQTLSEKRAAAVAASLAADFGIEALRLTASGMGESAPIAANDSPEGRAMNRRVEFSKS
jgi:OOP family OmpA-OmpF porin